MLLPPRGHGLSFTHLPPVFLDLLGSRLEKPQGNALGIGVQPRHRPPEGQRFIMIKPQNFSNRRRPKRQHPCPIHDKFSLDELPALPTKASAGLSGDFKTSVAGGQQCNIAGPDPERQ